MIIITKEVEEFQSVEVMTRRVVIIVVCFFNGGDRQNGRLYY